MWIREIHAAGDNSGEFILYSTSALAIDGAISSLGVTLADYRLVQDEICQGRLARITDHDLVTGRGFYLVWPKTAVIDAKAHAFRDWLLSELS